MTGDRPFWEGMSEGEVQAHLARVRSRLDVAAKREERERFEQAMAGADEHVWPPAPNTAHPSFERKARFVRELIDRDEYRVLIPAPMKARFLAVDDPAPEMSVEMPSDPIALEVRRCWALAPWSGRPFVYMWRVAVEASTNRWVAGDSWAEHPPLGQEWRAR